MPKRTLVTFLILLVTLTSCSSPLPSITTSLETDSDEVIARRVLSDYFRLLSIGEYHQAASLYAGSYDWLISNNPSVSPTDHAGLFEYGCSFNGLQCLESRTIIQDQSITLDEFVFLVEFDAADGSLFVLGPCCGATETEQSPVSRFQFHVSKLADGSFGVADLPVYVP